MFSNEISYNSWDPFRIKKDFMNSFSSIWGKATAIHWFSNIMFEQHTPGHISIVVSSSFIKSWIQEQYGTILESFLYKSIPDIQKLSWEVDISKKLNFLKKPLRIPNDTHIFSHAAIIPTFQNFIQGDCNRVAMQTSQILADEVIPPFNLLFLWGNVGLGKTHLLKALEHRRKKNFPQEHVVYLSSEIFKDHMMHGLHMDDYHHVDVLILDDIQFLGGETSLQKILLKILRNFINHQKYIVIASHAIPQNLLEFEPELISYFASGMMVQIKNPPYTVRLDILKNQSYDAFSHLSSDILSWIAQKIRSNVRDLLRTFIRLSVEQQIALKPLTLQTAQKIISLGAFSQEASLKDIQHTVAHYFHLRHSDLIGKTRSKFYCDPRHIAMYLCHKFTLHALEKIAHFFGKKDHTSVVYALKKIKKLFDTQNSLIEHIKRLEDILNF